MDSDWKWFSEIIHGSDWKWSENHLVVTKVQRSSEPRPKGLGHLPSTDRPRIRIRECSGPRDQAELEHVPKYSMGLPYMPISWGGLRGQCRHIWQTWSVWGVSYPSKPGHLHHVMLCHSATAPTKTKKDTPRAVGKKHQPPPPKKRCQNTKHGTRVPSCKQHPLEPGGPSGEAPPSHGTHALQAGTRRRGHATGPATGSL